MYEMKNGDIGKNVLVFVLNVRICMLVFFFNEPKECAAFDAETLETLLLLIFLDNVTSLTDEHQTHRKSSN